MTNKKSFLFNILQSLFIALFVALPFITHTGIDVRGSFSQEIGKIFTSITPWSILFFALIFAFFFFIDYAKIKASKQDTFLAFLFSAFLILGCLYASEYSWIKDYRNFIRIFLRMGAFFLLLRKLIACFEYGLAKLYVKDSTLSKEDWLLGKHVQRNATILLLLLWLPIIILSYPANLAGDTLWQLWEVTGEKEYWAHNPLLVTLMFKVFLSIGKLLFNSITAGFFLCSITQCICLALVLAYSLKRLYERGVGIIARRIVFAIYVFTPTYSNMATTPGKDLAYMALFLLYILFLEKIIHCLNHQDCKEQLTLSFWARFIFSTIVLCLVRKNGVYLVVPTGIILILFVAQNLSAKKKIILLLASCVAPFVGFELIQGFMEAATNATPGSIREMLSIPFQQTARYLNIYSSEISAFEREAINKVLLDADLVGRIYTPDISDPVKALYNLEATTTDLINYFKAWFIGLCKEPLVYIDAFFKHVYGWFYPPVVDLIRYNATDDILTVPAFFVDMRDKIRLFYEFPLFALIENIGLYVWTTFWLLFRKHPFEKKNPKLKYKWLLFPLFFSLLICMASPAFYDNARYAYPIVISVPFVAAILLKEQLGNVQD